MNTSVVVKVVRFTARFWGLAVAAVAAFFLISSGFGIDESGAGFRSWKEIAEFLCFPLGVSVGYLWAWKDELKGGLLAVLSVLILWALRPDLAQTVVFTTVILIPGLLHIWLGYTSWKAKQANG